MTLQQIESVAPACLLQANDDVTRGFYGTTAQKAQWNTWFEIGRNALAITFKGGGRLVVGVKALRLRHYKTQPVTLQIINASGTRRGNYCRLDAESAAILQGFKVAEKGNETIGAKR